MFNNEYRSFEHETWNPTRKRGEFRTRVTAGERIGFPERATPSFAPWFAHRKFSCVCHRMFISYLSHGERSVEAEFELPPNT